MFYILKLKLVSTRMGYIFTFLPDGHSPLILSSCPSPKTNYWLYLFQLFKEILVTQILSGELHDTPKDIAPNHNHLVKYVCTSNLLRN
ncbi:hypothetical protein C0J52_24264 [Blattella germanica]|nr:hypothetical protein C0J52_24264 [Blattella germanica]